jgi:hypothetical protein
MMDPTRAYDDEFFAPIPREKGHEPGAGGRAPFPRKSTVAVSLALIGSALFLARGCWYDDGGRDGYYRTGRVGGGHFFFAGGGGGAGYRGGPAAPSVGGSARGGFGATGVHAAGIG